MKRASSELVPIAEPLKLFKAARLDYFIECGGFEGLQSPAKMSAFNSEDACFVTIFPGKQRVYRFDSFGVLLEKFVSDSIPLCIAWNEESCQYLIGFTDFRIRRFNACLKAIDTISVPDKLEPRLLVCGGGHIYVSDLGERIICLGQQGDVQHQITLPGKVCHLAYMKARRCLVASISDHLIGLDTNLQILWSLDHFVSESRVAATAAGELWVALSSGQLWRLDRDNRKLVDVPIPPHGHTIATIQGGVVVGTLQGHLLVYDMLGRKLGDDDLQTALYHVCVAEGDLLVLSTAKGPTVVKPSPALTLHTQEQVVLEKALSQLLEWEKHADQGTIPLRRVLERDLQQLDLTCWQEVCALQSQFAQRRTLQPALYGKIETILRFIDPQITARICTKTIPVIIDGSNVSRYHWQYERDPKGSPHKKKKARLGAILRVREKLQSETNPVFYPIIIVVDVSERHYTDDLADLTRMISEGQILETPSAREADALILNLIKSNKWQHDCRIVSNDLKLFADHADMLSGVDEDWYQRVRMAFTINPKTQEIYFPERST
jgi:hypothetical protein